MRRIYVLAVTIALGAALIPTSTGADGGGRGDPKERYAADTWFIRLVEQSTGLPADGIGGDLRRSTRSEFTSPTNIGMYMWATTAASRPRA